MSTEQDQPLLKVVAGQPSDDELAALTAVVLALAGDGSARRAGRPWLVRPVAAVAPAVAARAERLARLALALTDTPG